MALSAQPMVKAMGLRISRHIASYADAKLKKQNEELLKENHSLKLRAMNRLGVSTVTNDAAHEGVGQESHIDRHLISALIEECIKRKV